MGHIRFGAMKFRRNHISFVSVLSVASCVAYFIFTIQQGSKSAAYIKAPTYSYGMRSKPFVNKITYSQTQRLEIVRNACSRRTEFDENAYNHNLYYSLNRNVTYCAVPKAGCTFWKRIMKYLNGDFQHLANANLFDVGRKAVHILPSLNVTARRPSVAQMSDSFKFMFVRDPFSRLWSAYIDKFFLPDFWSIGREVVRVIRKRRTICGNDVTFSEFIEYILWQVKNKTPLNDHWRPMHGVCDPCVFKPDFVGRFESFESDMEVVLEKLSAEDIARQFNGHSEQEIKANVEVVFHISETIRSSCITNLELTRRLWTSFQFNGHIPSNLSFPEQTLAIFDPLTKEIVTDIFLKQLRLRKFPAEDRRRQKRFYLKRAYSTFSNRTKEQLIELYKWDFELFDYSKYPDYIV